jgi:hypothetical protein
MSCVPPSDRLSALYAMVAILALAGCLFQGEGRRTAGGGDPSAVRGNFVDPSGRPLKGVRVTAIPKGVFRLAKSASSAAAAALPETTWTDAEGRYSLTHLRSGEYNLVGEYGQGELAALVPDVRYADSAGSLEMGQDTLHAPGSIRGRVQRGGRGQEGAIAYLPGTSYLAVSDTDGAFVAEGIPAGRYRVNYLVPGFQAAPDTGIVVRAGGITLLPSKALAYDTSQAPPAPGAPRAAFDSARGTVRLEWDRVDVSDLLGYLVYRDTGGASAPVLLTPRILPDTFLADTLPEWIWAGRETAKVAYRLRSIDRAKNPSPNFSPPAAIALARERRSPTALKVDVFGLNAGFVWQGDSTRVVVRFDNPSWPVDEIGWATDEHPPQTARDTVAGRFGASARSFAWRDSGDWFLRIEAVDSAGDTSRAETPIKVVPAQPEAFAGEDVTVSIGDSVFLAGHGEIAFGPIARMEWDIGATGRFAASGDGRVGFAAPGAPGRLACVFRATDAAGRDARDTAFVDVVAIPPTARISAPEAAFREDTVRVSGSPSSDSLGRIVAWEWDIGATGIFAKASGPDTAFVPGGADTAVTCVLRVTDDDGQASEARARIALRPRDQWIKIASDAPFADMSIFHSWVLGDQVYVTGAFTEARNGKGLGIWRSRDLRTWTPLDANIDGWAWGMPAPFAVKDGKVWGATAGKEGDPWRFMVSADGEVWEPVSGPEGLQDRRFTVAGALGDRIVYFGTYLAPNGRPLPEVWVVRTGQEPSLATDRAPFGARFNLTGTAMGGKIWAYGGMSGDTTFNEMWSSPDGAAWTRVAAQAMPEIRKLAFMLKQGDELIIVGGLSAADVQSFDVWRSRDGVRWTRDAARLPVLGGEPLTTRVLEFRGRLWMLASHPDRDGVPRGEVWAAP